MLGIMLGVLLFAGGAFAADANMLQPASDIVYNENVDINGSLDTDSLRVGTPGLGGVTFFNGTVLNEGADPFTVGDDMRVDGEIFRIASNDGNPVKFNDSIRIAGTIYPYDDASSLSNLGVSDLRWNDIYYSNKLLGKDADFSGSVDIADYLYIHTNSASDRVIALFNGNSPTIEMWGDGTLRVAKDLYVEGAIYDNQGPAVEFNDLIRLRKSSSTPTCNSTTEGSIYYNTISDHFWGCSSSGWRQLDTGGIL